MISDSLLKQFYVFQEHAIEARLMHIVHAIEHKEWPVSVNFTAGDEIETIDKEPTEIITITTDHGIPRSMSTSLSSNSSNINLSNIISGGTGSSSSTSNINIGSISNSNNNSSALRKRKRHIAIDVETERGN